MKHSQEKKKAFYDDWRARQRARAELISKRHEIELELKELNKTKLKDLADEYSIPYNTARAITNASSLYYVA